MFFNMKYVKRDDHENVEGSVSFHPQRLGIPFHCFRQQKTGKVNVLFNMTHSFVS